MRGSYETMFSDLLYLKNPAGLHGSEGQHNMKPSFAVMTENDAPAEVYKDT